MKPCEARAISEAAMGQGLARPDQGCINWHTYTGDTGAMFYVASMKFRCAMSLMRCRAANIRRVKCMQWNYGIDVKRRIKIDRKVQVVSGK